MFEELLSKGGISLGRLLAFLRVVEAGKIAKAAEGDESRQSQYSRQIAELEKFFGVALVQRKGKSIEILPTGKRLAELIREHFAAMDEFRQEHAGGRRVFMVGAGASLLDWLVCPRTPQILELFPQGALRVCSLRTPDIVERVRDGRLDFGIVRQDAVPVDLRDSACRTITTIGYVLVTPVALAKARRLSRKPDAREVGRLPLALLATGGYFHRSMQEAFKKDGMSLQAAVECESFLQVHEVVRSGCCAGILPVMFAAQLSTELFHISPLNFLEGHERTLALHWSDRQMQLRGVDEKTIEALAEVLSGPVGS